MDWAVKCTPNSGHKSLTQDPDFGQKELTHGSRQWMGIHLCYNKTDGGQYEYKKVIYRTGNGAA